MYKNLSLAKKLVVSLLLIAFIGAAIGVVGIVGMSRLNQEDKEMYEYNTLPMENLGTMYDLLATQRICASNMVIFREADSAFAAEEAESLVEKEQGFEEALGQYSKRLSDDNEKALYDGIVKHYNGEFKLAKDALRAAVASGDKTAMANAIADMDSRGSDVSSFIDEAFAYNDKLASEQVAANGLLFTTSTWILIGAIILGMAIAVLVSLYLARLIGRPVNRIKAAMQQVAQTGSLEFSQDVFAASKEDANTKDEISQMGAAFSGMMDALIDKTKTLEAVAAGDLSAEVRLASERDTIGNAIVNMLNNLNKMFHEINNISNQVAATSGEIAMGAQALAQGATEQAATVEEIGAAISQITEQSETSVNSARQAAQDGENIRNIAIEGNTKMKSMMNAVQEIDEASKSIGRVIKAIEDIAFQTNILALNAAVEAARAGQHGKGFAVVADEVRNLAAKSAEAAKETSELISANIEKAGLGLTISIDTAESLQHIVEGIEKTSTSLRAMTSQSENVRSATLKVNAAIDQVAQVVQQNSATSEQSAAASQEMSGQAQILKELIARFKLSAANR